MVDVQAMMAKERTAAIKDAKRRVEASGQKLDPYLAALVSSLPKEPAAKTSGSKVTSGGNSGTGTGGNSGGNTGNSGGNSGTGTGGNSGGNSGNSGGNTGTGTAGNSGTGTAVNAGNSKDAAPKVDPKVDPKTK